MKRNFISQGLVALTLFLHSDVKQDSVELFSITRETIEQIETSILQKDYQQAVDVYLSREEQQYCTTLDEDCLPEHFLVRSLQLHQFLPNAEICGTIDTPLCEDVSIDPSCQCPKYDMKRSSYVLEHIAEIDSSQNGFVYVTFDQDMGFTDMDPTIRTDNLIQIKTLPTGTAYKTRFDLYL